MTGSGEGDLTLRQFIDSVWFRGLSRACMILCTVLISGFIGLWAVVAGNTNKHVDSLDVQVNQIVQTIGDRAQDNEKFQQSTADSLSDVQTKMADLRISIGIVRGIVTELQNQKLALALAPPPELSR